MELKDIIERAWDDRSLLTDKEVIFLIDVGPKVKIHDIDFNGNDSFSSALLKTKIRSKTKLVFEIGEGVK